VGSDAHRPEDVGRDFERAEDLLSRAGFTSVVRFTKRRKIPAVFREHTSCG
jgi:histidinol-phosphatase (PHP family)